MTAEVRRNTPLEARKIKVDPLKIIPNPFLIGEIVFLGKTKINKNNPKSGN